MGALIPWLWLVSAWLSRDTHPQSSALIFIFRHLSLTTKLEKEALKRYTESGKDFRKWVQLLNWPERPFIDSKGLYPRSRRLTWPDSVSPLDLPDFETQARRLRYQTLGDECRKQQIRYLLLAHHDDDQAETVLMRLASGHKALGLQGMSSSADIPECWGMHGVNRSGKMDLAALKLQREEEKDPSSPHAQGLRQILTRDDIFEAGGVKIIRPLLGFSKERLIQTCRAQNLVWEEDKTNKDTWRTPRNNIRGLLRSAKLPQALQKTSLLQLAKQTSDTMRKQRASVEYIMSYCDILLLDARCGGLIVRLPLNIFLPRFNRVGSMARCRFKAALFLKRLVDNVTPQQEVSLQSLKQAAVSIFPELVAADRRLQPSRFTGGGVQFQRLHCPLPAPRSELDPAIRGTWEDLDPVFVWKLTRQPFSKAPLSLTVPPLANIESTTADNLLSWSSWQLWDGRYWIRLLNRSRRPLIVRPFQVSDLQYLRSAFTPQRYKDFHRCLSLAAPDKVRWTLLAIAELTDETLPMGRVLALPTLGQSGSFVVGAEDGTKVEWQIRYKSVLLGTRISDDGSSRINRNRNLVTSWKD